MIALVAVAMLNPIRTALASSLPGSHGDTAATTLRAAGPLLGHRLTVEHDVSHPLRPQRLSAAPKPGGIAAQRLPNGASGEAPREPAARPCHLAVAPCARVVERDRLYMRPLEQTTSEGKTHRV